MRLLCTVSSAVLSTICAFVLASGCGSDAVGVDACRDIEYARCEAAQHCGMVDDVDECKRFYRDQCLHGLRTDNKPGDVEVDECIAVIKLAGKCAAEGTELLADCSGWTYATTRTTPCEIIRFPQDVDKCAFLLKELEDASVPTHDTGSDAAADSASDAVADAPEGG